MRVRLFLYRSRVRQVLALVGYGLVIALLTLLFLIGLGIGEAAVQAPWPIIFVSSPRDSATVKGHLPDVFHPLGYNAGTHVMLLLPGHTTPELLVDGGVAGAAIDPVPSFDAQWVYYAYSADVSNAGRVAQRNTLPRGNFHLYKIHLITREVVQLTHDQETLTHAGQPRTLRHTGIYNVAPCPLPGGKVMFVSSRNGLLPNKEYTDINLQLYLLDEQSGITEQIGFLNLGSALHPVVMTNGKVMFASYEAQGLRDKRLWGIWAITPDGRDWEPLLSAFGQEYAYHWHGQKSDGNVLATFYYNLNNGGFGTLLQSPTFPPGQLLPFVRFGSFSRRQNPLLRLGQVTEQFSYTPVGLNVLTPFATHVDRPSQLVNGQYVGKVSHPSGAPGNSVLLTWTSGPANKSLTPTYDAGVYLLPAGVVATQPSQLVKVIDEPTRNEMQPKALVPYRDIYGIDAPPTLPWLPQGQHPGLPVGTPYGLIGTSTVYKRGSAPGSGTFGGFGPFNGPSSPTVSNWLYQGADAGLYTNTDIAALRLVVFEPTSISRVQFPFLAHGNERVRILADVPLRKPGAPMDPDGNPDTSVLVKLLANVPFGMQLLDHNGMVLTGAQTWKQVRPGSVDTRCGGCHSHDQQGTDFARTAAGQPGYVPFDATGLPLRSLEFVQDIRPILRSKCISCHSTATKAGGLILDDMTLEPSGNLGSPAPVPRDYAVLAHDRTARLGRKPPVEAVWREMHASAYIRKHQARGSLLTWMLYGQRLDGRTNATAADDLDYTSREPAHLLLTAAERQTIVQWIDTGAAFGSGWGVDETKPTVVLTDTASGPVLGLGDVGSGLDMVTVSVTLDGVAQPVTVLGEGRWQLPRGAGRWKASIQDRAGNLQTGELVSGVPPVSAGQTLYERCGQAPVWDSLPATKHATWQECAQP